MIDILLLYDSHLSIRVYPVCVWVTGACPLQGVSGRVCKWYWSVLALLGEIVIPGRIVVLVVFLEQGPFFCQRESGRESGWERGQVQQCLCVARCLCVRTRRRPQ